MPAVMYPIGPSQPVNPMMAWRQQRQQQPPQFMMDMFGGGRGQQDNMMATILPFLLAQQQMGMQGREFGMLEKQFGRRMDLLESQSTAATESAQLQDIFNTLGVAMGSLTGEVAGMKDSMTNRALRKQAEVARVERRAAGTIEARKETRHVLENQYGERIQAAMASMGALVPQKRTQGVGGILDAVLGPPGLGVSSPNVMADYEAATRNLEALAGALEGTGPERVAALKAIKPLWGELRSLAERTVGLEGAPMDADWPDFTAAGANVPSSGMYSAQAARERMLGAYKRIESLTAGVQLSVELESALERERTVESLEKVLQEQGVQFEGFDQAVGSPNEFLKRFEQLRNTTDSIQSLTNELVEKQRRKLTGGGL